MINTSVNICISDTSVINPMSYAKSQPQTTFLVLGTTHIRTHRANAVRWPAEAVFVGDAGATEMRAQSSSTAVGYRALMCVSFSHKFEV